MSVKRSPDSLTLADLPGADPARFAEWKQLHRRAQLATLLSPLVYATGFITVPVIGGGIGWLLPIVFWFIYMFVYARPLASAERALAIELGVPGAIGLPAMKATSRTRRVIKIVLIVWFIGFVLGLIALAVQLATSKRAPASIADRSAASAPAQAAAEPYVVHLKDVPGEYEGARVPPRFFEEGLARPHAGRFFLPGDYEAAAAPVVVISHNAWTNVFNSDGGVLGRTIQLNGRDATVVGIAPPAFRVPGWTDFWTPAAADK